MKLEFNYENYLYSIETNNNIAWIFGQNDTGKSTLATFLAKSFKNSSKVSLEINGSLIKKEEYTPILFGETFDIQKEINLKKGSILRTEIIKYFYQSNFEIDEIIKYLDDKLFSSNSVISNFFKFNPVEQNQLSLKQRSKINNIEDLIDNFIAIDFFENDQIVSDDLIAQSKLKWFYLQIILNKVRDSKQKHVLIFDCPESYFDYLSYEDYLTTLYQITTQDNIVIIFSRNHHLLQFDNERIMFSTLDQNKQLKNYKITKQINNLLIAIINWDKEKFNNFNLYLNQIEQIVDQNDINILNKRINYLIKLAIQFTINSIDWNIVDNLSEESKLLLNVILKYLDSNQKFDVKYKNEKYLFFQTYMRLLE